MLRSAAKLVFFVVVDALKCASVVTMFAVANFNEYQIFVIPHNQIDLADAAPVVCLVQP